MDASIRRGKFVFRRASICRCTSASRPRKSGSISAARASVEPVAFLSNERPRYFAISNTISVTIRNSVSVSDGMTTSCQMAAQRGDVGDPTGCGVMPWCLQAASAFSNVGQPRVAEAGHQRLTPIGADTSAALAGDPAEPVAREIGDGVCARHGTLKDGTAVESSRDRARVASSWRSISFVSSARPEKSSRSNDSQRSRMRTLRPSPRLKRGSRAASALPTSISGKVSTASTSRACCGRGSGAAREPPNAHAR